VSADARLARLSLYDYKVSRELAKSDPSFYALIAAAMRCADTRNLAALIGLYPLVYADLDARYNASGGILVGEDIDPGEAELPRRG
jgi:hypothetical protein